MGVSLETMHYNSAKVVLATLVATFTLAAWTGWFTGLTGSWAAVFIASLAHLVCAFTISQDLARKLSLLAALTEVMAVGIFLR